MKKLLLILLLTFILQGANSQITRGALDDEIYFISHIYDHPVSYVTYMGVFRSTDNGKSISLQFMYSSALPWDFWLTYPVGDANPGTLYSKNINHSFAKSMDYGHSWEVIETPGNQETGKISSGCIPGEIYKHSTPYENILWRSTDYGVSFDSLCEYPLISYIEIGAEEGELYGSSTYRSQFYLYYSSDYGQSFEVIPVDTSISFTRWLSRGSSPGELYLVGKKPDDPNRFQIHYSHNYGQDFELRYVSDSLTDYYIYSFTAGRVPGTFYMCKLDVDPVAYPLESEAYIYYSHDTAKTFELYFHELKLMVGEEELKANEVSLNIKINPNPAHQEFTINYTLSSKSTMSIELWDINGRKADDILKNSQQEKGTHSISWNAAQYPPGIYFCKVKSGENMKVEKIVISR